MSLARNLLLRASRSRWMADQLRQRAFFQRATRRFMPGEDLGAALDAAQKFAASNIGAVLTELGEQVSSPAEVAAVQDHYAGLFSQLRARRLPADVSVKLTHLGLDLDRQACSAHVRSLASLAADSGSFLWIDMEESRYVDATLDVLREARATTPKVGVCLQAYLHRTRSDLDALLALDASIRLVKGAYNEPREVALQSKPEVDARYAELADRMLARAGGDTRRAVFGTHDDKLVQHIRSSAKARRAPSSAFEIHMLYGIRADEQRRLAADGCTVKVLISYGSAWFAWYMRRLAERPANVWFVVRNIV